MTYTEKEIELLRNATDQITSYLTSLQPRVRETIRVLFCTDKYGGTPHIIELSNRSISGSIGQADVKFNDSCPNQHARDVHKAPDYMAMLVHHWPEIKSKILREIEYQESILSSITSFEL